MKKMKVSELIRRALYFAQQDRLALADAYSDVPNSKEREEALREADQFKQYRIKRFGRTEYERELDERVKMMKLSEIKNLLK